MRFRYDPDNPYLLLWYVNERGERSHDDWEIIMITDEWLSTRPVNRWVKWCMRSRMVDAGLVFA